MGDMLSALDKMFSYRCGAKCLGGWLFLDDFCGVTMVFEKDLVLFSVGMCFFGCWEIASSFGETMKLKIFRWLKERSTRITTVVND